MNEEDLNRALSEIAQDSPDKYPSTWRNIVTGFKARRTAQSREAQRDALHQQVELKREQVEGFASLRQTIRQVRKQEREAEFDEIVENAPPDVKIKLLEGQLRVDQLKMQRQRVLNETRSLETGIRPAIEQSARSGPHDTQQFEVPHAAELDDRSIKALAYRGLMKVGAVPAAERDGALAAWLQSLRSYLPSEVMTKVEREVNELRSLERDG